MEKEKGASWPRYAFYSLIVIVVLLVILILFLYMIRSPLIFRSGATSLTTTSIETTPKTNISLDNSYVFASPLRAKTGGEKIRITVFVLDARGLGIPGKKVAIGGGNLLLVIPIQPSTDGQGRATFDISCDNSPGAYIITASAEGTKLEQEATISFD